MAQSNEIPAALVQFADHVVEVGQLLHLGLVATGVCLQAGGDILHFLNLDSPSGDIKPQVVVLLFDLLEHLFEHLVASRQTDLGRVQLRHQSVDLRLRGVEFARRVSRLQHQFVDEWPNKRHLGAAVAEWPGIDLTGDADHLVELITGIIQVAAANLSQQLVSQSN
ncbi:hypothetical protein D3C86_1407070 [compost metagenome]